MKLRPYQEQAMHAILEAKPKKKAMIVLPVGSGKTVIIAHVLRCLGVTSLIVVPSKEILYQVQDTLQAVWRNVSIGCIGYGKESYGTVTIATVQSLRSANRIEALQKRGIEVICVDECHHSPAKTYQDIFEAFPDVFRFGVTATPDRLDRESVVDIFGYPVYELSMLDLIRQGYLCNIRAYRVETAISLEEVKIRAGEYSLEQLERVCDRTDRNEIIVSHYKKHAYGKPAICFAVSVEHAHNLANTFLAHGIQARAISAQTPQGERDTILKQYALGEIHVLCNCQLFTEGFDAPYTVCILLARPTMSRALYVQMVGRGVRTYEGKEECIIIDFADNTTMHSLIPPSLQDIGLKHGKTALEVAEENEVFERGRKQLLHSIKALTEKVVNLFEEIKPEWDYYEDGTLSLSIGQFTYELVPDSPTTLEGRNQVTYELYLHIRRSCYLLYEQLTFKRGVVLLCWFLSEIERGKAKYLDPTPRWQKDSATPSQLTGLRWYGIDITDVRTKWDASLKYAALNASALLIEEEEISC